ncbi:hypothetical protein AB6A40_005809 [Gnathostoma spinigerum]|uniref:1-acylglycerol-3-phosphate O-acyltransferase n=1 Tax=Gnathostoma spinigerum TaxID=75299 RepID=A0ABD6EGI0_9BILA
MDDVEFIILSVCLLLIPLWTLSAGFRFWVKLLLFGISIALAASFAALISLPFGRSPRNHRKAFWILHRLNFWMALNLDLRNTERLASSDPYIVICNHQSALDVLMVSYIWPDNCVALMKSSLRFAPAFNIYAYLCCDIFVERFVKEEAWKCVDNALSVINTFRCKVWIFPEGTRNCASNLLPFKKGAFVLAKKANLPIVPVVISSYKPFYDWETMKFDPHGNVVMYVLPAIDPTSFSDVDSLIDHCRQKMNDEFRRMSFPQEMRNSSEKVVHPPRN